MLVAVPRDFGYFGEVEGTGRYAPWRNADNQAKFKADLIRMIDLILAGKKDVVTQEHAARQRSSPRDRRAPQIQLTDLAGHPLTADQLSGRVVLVEFWATWCPPCRSTLAWLGELQRKYGDNIAIVAVAVESPEDQVRSTVKSLSPDLHWAIADAATATGLRRHHLRAHDVPVRSLGQDGARSLRRPPDLHQQAEKSLDALVR